MSDEKQNIIVDHALLNKDNLLMYLEIFNSFSSFKNIMNRLISDFLKELESAFIADLDNSWVITNEFNNDALEKGYWYCIFAIQKKAWQDAYAIGFNPDSKKLRNVCFYAWRNTDILKTPITEVTEKLNQKYMNGRTEGLHDWAQKVDMHYLDWTNAETISKLYDKKLNFRRAEIATIS